MINKYFYIILDKDDSIIEVSTSVDYPQVSKTEGPGQLVVFHMNVLDSKEKLLKAAKNYPTELQTKCEAAINLFF